MAKETSCFPKKIISPELFWSESQKSWISSETKNTVAKIKEDKSETETQQKPNLLCRYCYVYRVLRLTLEISKHTQKIFFSACQIFSFERNLDVKRTPF